mmetsp:Transcript_32408/g.52448  ORF Transcript_32408/g.52448 Transcript_32408/m.52448 type:complete len:201 (-) Transcript_32408:440-1042(-)
METALTEPIYYAHANIAAFGVVGLLTAGAFVAIFLKARFKWWLQLHIFLNSLALAFVVAAIAAKLIVSGIEHPKKPHFVLAIVALCLLSVAALTGLASRNLAFASQRFARYIPDVRMVHRWLGRLSLTIGLITCCIGADIMFGNQTPDPLAVYILYLIYFSLAGGAVYAYWALNLFAWIAKTPLKSTNPFSKFVTNSHVC